MTRRERRYYLALAKRAGIDPSEIMDRPEFGLCIKPSAVHKLVSLAPDKDKAKYVVAQVDQLVRSLRKSQFRVVPGDKS